MQAFAGITHIQWLKDKDSGKFYGSTFVEMVRSAPLPLRLFLPSCFPHLALSHLASSRSAPFPA